MLGQQFDGTLDRNTGKLPVSIGPAKAIELCIFSGSQLVEIDLRIDLQARSRRQRQVANDSPEPFAAGTDCQHQQRDSDKKYGQAACDRADQTRVGIRSLVILRMRDIAHRPDRQTQKTPLLSTEHRNLSSVRRCGPSKLFGEWNSGSEFSLKNWGFLGRSGPDTWYPLMGQIFSPAADTWLRLFLLGAVSLAAGSVVFAIGLARSDWVTGARIHPPAQPVPFSHRHHAGELGIDCRYCHTSVAEGPHAGLPPTYTCMSCHSQIWTGAPMLAPVRASLADNKSIDWNRVAVLPEYVFFRHDIHVAKGVGCVECHGRVDKMALTYRAKALTMQFCLDCHRDPAPHLRPLDQVTNMDWRPQGDGKAAGHALLKQYGIRTGEITHCYVCHR
jgi:hypothetical protein